MPHQGNRLDHCYTTVKDAYRAVPRAALGLSDHVMVHLIPTDRQKLKLTKPSVSPTKRWTSEAVEELRTCLDTTDWDMFKGATHDLDEYTDTGTSYIHFCEERILPTRTRSILPSSILPSSPPPLLPSSILTSSILPSSILHPHLLHPPLLPSSILTSSILPSSITVWCAGATARDRLRLQRVVRAAEKVIGCRLPSIQDLYISRTRRCAGRRLRSIRTRTSRYTNSFFPSAIRLLNTK
ncbi:hypothetical protein D4764_0097380 [Takifugu flavidus]|uniref:Uncharacterized protein n=1 Tax=Takifugu flavidus TaxID=433684 RepID=A0A5C6MI58_9TELE|nr:hypothetical protein D4764_0097380 [Takifugu flavidus]